jgi:hypothetical protein
LDRNHQTQFKVRGGLYELTKILGKNLKTISFRLTQGPSQFKELILANFSGTIPPQYTVITRESFIAQIRNALGPGLGFDVHFLAHSDNTNEVQIGAVPHCEN